MHLFRRVLLGVAFLSCLVPVARAHSGVSCALEQGGDESVLQVPEAPDALQGAWQALGMFRIRAVLARPASRPPWLRVEVHARHEDGDYRLVSSQKVFAPFVTGQVEIVEPGLGRSLRYACEARR